jgi:hypothetical protein
MGLEKEKSGLEETACGTNECTWERRLMFICSLAPSLRLFFLSSKTFLCVLCLGTLVAFVI